MPAGWEVIDDVGAETCEAPAGRADVTGRVVAARMSIESFERQGLVPHRPIEVVVDDLVADALADHPHAWLVDRSTWPVATSDGGWVDGVRIDVAHHDMSTPLFVTTVLARTADGLVMVTASTPVAHQLALGTAVEDALGTLVLERAADAAGWAQPPASAWVDGRTLAYAAPTTWMSDDAFHVFATGSYKIAARWRPEALAAGLVDERGVATPLGGYVRRAVSRPDVRAAVTVCPADMMLRPASGQVPALPTMMIDRLDGLAVLRATVQPALTTVPMSKGAGHVSLEVLDAAAAPARVAGWLGLGPQRTAQLPEGTVAVVGSVVSAAPGVPAVERPGALLSHLPGPREAWHRVLAALS